VKIALVCPDGLSILLFCKGIIRTLQTVPGARVYVLCDAGRYAAEIRALDVSCVSIPVYRWISPWEDLKYTLRLWRAMRSHRFDIVLNFSTKPNICGTFAARFSGVKLNLMHIVGLGSAFQPRQGVQGRVVRRMFIAAYRLACRLSDRVWFTNSRDRQFFIDNHLVSADATVLSRNYLDTREYALSSVDDRRREEARVLCKLRPDEKMVIMVARLIWQKGVREFAEAAELLHESRPELKFVLVAPEETGSPDVVPRSFVLEKEKSSNFKWLGFQDDVKRLYAVADLAVLPTYYKEGGFPRGLLEPMSMGKPVITTTSEDCRGAVEEGKNGFLVPIRDSRALAEAITRIMSNDSLRRAFGNYSRVKAVRDFDELSILPETLRKMAVNVPVLGPEREDVPIDIAAVRSS